MIFATNNNTVKNTSYKVVLPFYFYAAISFLVATFLLQSATSSFLGHYFQPHILAITHCMALGWGTMMILGAAHQLVPVLIESQLYSDYLAYLSFLLAAFGIPSLIYGFYNFDMGIPTQLGGWLILLSILSFSINLIASISKSKGESIHALFVLAAIIWLFLTALLGLLQVYNFTHNILSNDSLFYISLHAHLGIVGWFLLLIIGVASRLIPMFLISKYSNTKLLKIIFALINSALILFLFIFANHKKFLFIPIFLVLSAIIFFIFYCYSAYKQRIRKQLDEQMKLSLFSVSMLLVPLFLLIFIIVILMITSSEKVNAILTYGFLVFFGWVTSIILGMTFKTLPFIVWNKVYHHLAGVGKTPSPKELFNDTVFKIMSIFYLFGMMLFSVGIWISNLIILNIGSLLLILTAMLYIWNVMKILFHKPKIK